MVIENIMYFVLGLLAAGLVALIILPAVWRRAVRLTKKRIEAATPVSMAEFRADKDQLRAEFALSTRRLEMTVESLRGRLAKQLGDVNQKRSDLSALLAEREKHVSIVAEMESREAELRARVIDCQAQDAGYRVNTEFESLTDTQRQLLARYILQKQAQARRLAREQQTSAPE